MGTLFLKPSVFCECAICGVEEHRPLDLSYPPDAQYDNARSEFVKDGWIVYGKETYCPICATVYLTKEQRGIK